MTSFFDNKLVDDRESEIFIVDLFYPDTEPACWQENIFCTEENYFY